MALSENAKRVAALMEEGKDPATIAKELRMSIADVHEHRTAVFAEMDTRAREEKLRNPDGRKRGRRHKRTTDDELLDLAEMLGAGIKQAAIAYKMGRSVPWVSKHKAQALELWDAKRGEELARQTPPAPVAESRQEELTDGVHFTEDGTLVGIRDAIDKGVSAMKSLFTPVELPDLDEQPDMVNPPPHYRQGRFECFDVIVALLGVEGAKYFCKGNIIKYRYRAAAKNGAEDIAKADRYMDMLKELERVKHNADYYRALLKELEGGEHNDEAPTIEAEPVRHGQWVKVNSIQGLKAFKCSECSSYIGRITAFCSTCGAKMDGKEKKNETD